MRKQSIRNRLMQSFAVLIIVMVVCHIGFNTFLAKKVFVYEKSKILQTSFQKLKNIYTDDLDEVETFAEDIQNNYGIRMLLFCDDQMIYNNIHGNSNRTSYQKAKKFEWKEAEYSENPKVQIQEENGGKKSQFLQICGKFAYEREKISVQLMIPMDFIENTVTLFTKSEFYILLVVLVVGILVAFYFAKNITSPITDIEIVSKHIAQNDFSYHADEDVALRELASLAKSVNHMSDQLRKNMLDLQEANIELQKDIDNQKRIEKMRKEFIASVSHDMKTPLSLLQIYTENLKSNDMDIDKEYYYDTILEETDKLSVMISRMLEISSLDCGFTQLHCAKFCFSDLVSDILQQYQLMLEEYMVEIEIQDNLYINGDERYLEQCIKNLLNNAIQYTKKNRGICIQLTECPEDIHFSIFNEGAHIADEDMEHIWDAFFREDQARIRTKKNNVGLGLYIVKTIVEKHNACCYARNEKDGVLFVIEFPKT